MNFSVHNPWPSAHINFFSLIIRYTLQLQNISIENIWNNFTIVSSSLDAGDEGQRRMVLFSEKHQNHVLCDYIYNCYVNLHWQKFNVCAWSVVVAHTIPFTARTHTCARHTMDLNFEHKSVLILAKRRCDTAKAVHPQQLHKICTIAPVARIIDETIGKVTKINNKHDSWNHEHPTPEPNDALSLFASCDFEQT